MNYVNVLLMYIMNMNVYELYHYRCSKISYGCYSCAGINIILYIAFIFYITLCLIKIRYYKLLILIDFI